MNSELCDLVVLGGGSGGYAAALRAAQLGQSVVLVEADRVGGTCLHRGCVPTKALLHTGEVADTAREGSTIGVDCGEVTIDLGTARDHAQGIIDRLHRGLSGLVDQRGIRTVIGDGVLDLTGEHPSVRVGDAVHAGRSVVVATGATPRLLPGLPDDPRILTSETALQLDTVPRRAVVVGGGVIGVEFASLWRSLGSEVTVVEATDQLLPGEDPEIATALQRSLRRRGITCHTATMVNGITAHDELRVDLPGTTLAADVVLVAIGRVPHTEALTGLDLTDSGHVRVDDRLCTSDPRVRAVGDLVAGPQLAHRGFAHGLFVADDLAGRSPRPVDDTTLPRIVYSDPSVLSVGLSERQAQQRHGADMIEVQKVDLGANARSLILGSRGFVRLIRRRGGEILGVQAIGRGVGELAGEAQLMTAWEALPEEVADLVHAHPTIDETLGEAALALAGRALHLHD